MYMQNNIDNIGQANIINIGYGELSNPGHMVGILTL